MDEQILEHFCVPNSNQDCGILRKCAKCGETKKIKMFNKNRSREDCHTLWCKQCINFYRRIRYKNNPEKVVLVNKRWESKNQDKVRKKRNRWNKLNPEKAMRSCINWRKNNPEKQSVIHGRACRKHREKNKLSSNISAYICRSLRGNKKGRHWEIVVGYGLDDLKKHIEKQFRDGMSWNNYGKGGWSIDHKIPVSVFNFEKPEDDDFKRCWSLSNLQPLWVSENSRKQNKIDKSFQPRLIFK